LIDSLKYTWCLADGLACSQNMSHPEMRLVSAAIGTSFSFSLLKTLVHAGFCMFPLAHRDCRIFIVHAWRSKCNLVQAGFCMLPLAHRDCRIFTVHALF
jgi:hypothetical protein